LKSNELITVDEEILGGTPVFNGTRVPVKTLEHLGSGYSLEEFIDCFPSVNIEKARQMWECLSNLDLSGIH
jgi:uncharacterized protein (DUF433 family)